MNCEQHIYSPVEVEDYLPTSSSDTSQSSPSNLKSHAVDHCAPVCRKDGYHQNCTSTAATCESSISPHGPGAWIASQRDSLARIFHALDREKASKAHAPALSGKCSEQLTLFGQDWCFSKTRQKSGPKVDATLSVLSWREDTPGAMERLPLLLSEQVTSGIDGGCSLPTLTACGNWNRKGASENSGDGLATKLRLLPTLTASEVTGWRTRPEGTTISGMTPEGKKVQIGIKNALKMLPTLTASDATGGAGRGRRRTGGDNLRTMLPTLCASDYKSPYSEAGYQKQALTRFKPLRDTLVHTTGHRLTPEFAEWWMGWPLRWTVAPKAHESKPAATDKSRSLRLPRG